MPLLKRSIVALKKYLLLNEREIAEQAKAEKGPLKDFKVVFFDVVGRWPNANTGSRG